MRSSSRQLRDGSRVTLRQIAPEDKQLLADAFERLSDDSRYRRFFTLVKELSASDLAFLTEVDHQDHEAIVALDPSTGAALGVARYVRDAADPEAAEAAVTVVDDWQGRGLGRVLLERLAGRARREGVRRFSAVVQADNIGVIGLLEGLGDTERSPHGAELSLLIELPKRGIGAQLARLLRAAADGSFVAADTLAHRVAEGARPARKRPPPKLGRPLRTIVVGTDGSPASEQAVQAAVELATRLDADLHLISAYRVPSHRRSAQADLARARRTATHARRRAATYALREHPAEAIISVAEQQDADLIVVGGRGMTTAARFVLGSVADAVARHAPCSVLIVRTGEPPGGG